MAVVRRLNYDGFSFVSTQETFMHCLVEASASRKLTCLFNLWRIRHWRIRHWQGHLTSRVVAWVLLPTLIVSVNVQASALKADNQNQALYTIATHHDNYLLPLSYNINQNQARFKKLGTDTSADKLELAFQFSGKIGLHNDLFSTKADLYFAYTQRSWWQAFNTEASSPFRETNYAPEFFIEADSNWQWLGWQNTRNRLALNHQSNGQSGELSRSWNRVYADILLEHDAWALILTPHWRIPEAASQDDNPLIHHYMGYGDVQVARRLGQGREIAAKWRGNPFTGHHGVQVDASWPINNGLRGHLQYYLGYGENLIDHDSHVHRLSLGFSLNPMFDADGFSR